MATEIERKKQSRGETESKRESVKEREGDSETTEGDRTLTNLN